jgi:molecular chaperone GrpE
MKKDASKQDGEELDPESTLNFGGEDTNEDISLEDEEELTTGALKKLREKLKIAEQEKMEYLAGWQRSKAEFINVKKQQGEERKDLVKFATLGLIEDLIPVLQSFDSAMANKEVWEKVDSAWRMGIEYIYTMLLDVLKQRGLTVINPLNEEFNPSLHEAVETREVGVKEDDGKIVAVLQKGFMLQGKVLRGARVVVGKIAQ